MRKSDIFDFHLEADDRTEEEKQKQKAPKKDGLGSALGLSKEAPKAPMDTDYQEEMEPVKPQIRFNLNFDKGIRGEASQPKRDSSTFTIERLFEAVASRDVNKLDGLYQYLHQNMKKLSDSLYQTYGKTALMKALLHLKDGKNETIEELVKVSERIGDIKEFVNAAFTDSYYKGQTALHIAIERRSLSYVKLLVSKGADVHAKACGKFFQPHDGPNFYFGELPLSLAACTNQPDIADDRTEEEKQKQKAPKKDGLGSALGLSKEAPKAPMDTDYQEEMEPVKPQIRFNLNFDKGIRGEASQPKRDSSIFTIERLFEAVASRDVNKLDGLYQYLHQNMKKLSDSLYQTYGKTALMKALLHLKDGKNETIEELVKVSERIGDIKEFVNAAFTDSYYKGQTALHIAIERRSLSYVKLLVSKGADVHAKACGKFFQPHDGPNFYFDAWDYLYVFGQLLTLLANCYFFVFGIIEMKRKRPKLQSLLIDGYYEILFFSQGLLFLAATVLYWAGRQEYLGFLVICLALSWVNVLYYSRGDKHMGIYSVMIQKMILSDILRFLFVYVVFLFGFSAAVVTLLIQPPPENTTGKGRQGLFGTAKPDTECFTPTYRNISYTTLQLFKFTIGMGDMEFTQDYQYMEVFYVLLIFYIILTYILLLNMLIALMSRTVEKITEESASIWRLQRAVTIMDMENRLPCCLKNSFRSGVERKLGTAFGDDRRRCFRVEEMNWNKWNTNLVNISEDPGYCDRGQKLDLNSTSRGFNRGRSLRDIFMEGTWRRSRMPQSTEMSPLNI
ncbi:transient receptor potential cation channel subfamily V member 1-like [Poecilia latipinna]|uniref:transient receptor potential cation channel subfamily V member 1-like n=1 Tax=Poecilia latipinna TaxID=48699 RepID=UPI00072EB2CA|nr:PREDICTED: transient receptor potential cation channel subfamily V member 1-like [Poecilia latipinna]